MPNPSSDTAGAPSPPGRRVFWTAERTILAAGVIAVASLALLAYHASTYLPFLSDDALITLRYAERFLAGEGLTWNDGERVEGYSNLLWLLSAAALGRVGVDLVDAVRLLGALGMGAVPLLLLGTRLRPAAAPVLAVSLASLAWAASAPVAVWTVGGLEQPLVVALLTAAILLAWQALERWEERPGGVVLAATLAALCLTRPDAPLLAGVVVAWLAWQARGRPPLRRAAMAAGIGMILAVLGQLAFRQAYYGEWVPNTALIKVAPSATHFAGGLRYVAQGLIPLAPLVLVGVGATVVAWRHGRRAPLILLAMVAGPWLAYVAFVGGDVFPGWRHLLVFLVTLVCAMVVGLEQAFLRWHSAGQRVGVIALCGVAIAASALLQTRDARNVAAKKETWEWGGAAVGDMLRRGFAQPPAPLLAVTASGALAYWSRLPCLDLLGLNDRYLARNPDPRAAEMKIGHGHGDADYLMRRNPDLVIWGSPGGGRPSGIYRFQLKDRQDYRQRYASCFFMTEGPVGAETRRFVSKIEVNRASPRVGVSRVGALIDVPVYFLATGRTVTQVDEQGRFFVLLTPDRAGRFDELELEAGMWEVLTPHENIEITLVAADGTAFETRAMQEERTVIVLEEPATCSVLARTQERVASLRNLRLRRWTSENSDQRP